MDDFQVCAHVLENLKKRGTDWAPSALEDILALIPRETSSDDHFRLSVLLVNWICVARKFRGPNWFPNERDIENLIELYATLQSTKNNE